MKYEREVTNMPGKKKKPEKKKPEEKKEYQQRLEPRITKLEAETALFLIHIF